MFFPLSYFYSVIGMQNIINAIGKKNPSNPKKINNKITPITEPKAKLIHAIVNNTAYIITKVFQSSLTIRIGITMMNAIIEVIVV